MSLDHHFFPKLPEYFIIRFELYPSGFAPPFDSGARDRASRKLPNVLHGSEGIRYFTPARAVSYLTMSKLRQRRTHVHGCAIRAHVHFVSSGFTAENIVKLTRAVLMITAYIRVHSPNGLRDTSKRHLRSTSIVWSLNYVEGRATCSFGKEYVRCSTDEFTAWY